MLLVVPLMNSPSGTKYTVVVPPPLLGTLLIERIRLLLLDTVLVTVYSVAVVSYMKNTYLIPSVFIIMLIKMFNSVSRIESESKQTFYKHLLSYF